jgi:SAM-dependent methyltransferase
LLTSLAGLLAASSWRLNIDMPAGSGDRWADDYERGRPSYPSEAVGLPDLSPASTVLDLGAGTGKLSRPLVGRFDRVIAVEPADAMRRVLAMVCPEAQALTGSAEAIPLGDGSVDAVFAAEAFHWFDGERALNEIARVLRPRGALVLMWNVPAGPMEPPIAALDRLIHARAPRDLDADPADLSARRYTSGEWRPAIEASAFGELHEARLPNPQTFDRDGLMAFLASMGWIADLPDVDRLPLLDQMRSLLDADEYRRPWETHVCWTRLRS